MSRQYPIWNDIEACNYKSDKSFGSKNTMSLTQYVGSSSSNSHRHIGFSTTRRDLKSYKGFENVIIFKSFIDSYPVKEMIFSSKNGRPDEMLWQEYLIDVTHKINQGENK